LLENMIDQKHISTIPKPNSNPIQKHNNVFGLLKRRHFWAIVQIPNVDRSKIVQIPNVDRSSYSTVTLLMNQEAKHAVGV